MPAFFDRDKYICKKNNKNTGKPRCFFFNNRLYQLTII